MTRREKLGHLAKLCRRLSDAGLDAALRGVKNLLSAELDADPDG